MAYIEGWVFFHRLYCLTGYIDYWEGDAINNPNVPNKSNFQINSTARYYRLNGSTHWARGSCFKDGFRNDVIELMKEFPAWEIWEDYVIPEELKEQIRNEKLY